MNTRILTYRQAVAEAIAEEMAHDETEVRLPPPKACLRNSVPAALKTLPSANPSSWAPAWVLH